MGLGSLPKGRVGSLPSLRSDRPPAFRPLGRVLPSLAVALLLVLPSQGFAAGDVVLLPVAPNDDFPEATAPEAIRYACASGAGRLASFFEAKGLKMDPVLIRPREGYAACHVFYEPTIPGFRASPDNQPVTGLFAAPDSLAFILKPQPTGESVDVVKSVLSRIERPLDVSLRIATNYDPAYWNSAMGLHFADTPHRIRLLPVETGIGHPWNQDHMKAGEVGGQSRILVPWRLFEDHAENGPSLMGLLDSYQGEPFVRSKLAWEGGDLAFVLNPRDPKRLILLFGKAALGYWGGNLDRDEFAYILRTEFGADRAIDLADIGPHSDFLVAFLPEKNIALVSQPERENLGVAVGAAIQLRQAFGPKVPKDAIELIAFLERSKSLQENPGYVHEKVTALRQQLTQVTTSLEPDVVKAFNEYIATHCPEAPKTCLSADGKAKMMSAAPDLVRRMTETGNEEKLRRLSLPVLLGLIEGQLPDAPRGQRKILDEKARELQKLGFQVERVPYLTAPESIGDWGGISYVNLLALDKQLFVPIFGLGPAEEQIVTGLQTKLGADYEVVPVPARAGLLLNGGVHCVFGIVRGTDPSPQLPRLTERRQKIPGVPAASPNPSRRPPKKA